MLSPSLERMLIEMAVGETLIRCLRNSSKNAARRICYPPPFTTADRAAELLAATSALQYLRTARAAAQPPRPSGSRTASRALVASIIAAQNQDGGWPWVSGESTPRLGPKRAGRSPERPPRLGRRRLALASAEPLGLLTDVKVLDQAVAFLSGEFAKLSGNDHETRAALLHALSTRRAASFEAANSLNRVRNQLSDPALAYLALTFANLDRASLADEVIGILGPRAKTEATAPGRPARDLLGFGPNVAGSPRRRRDDGAGQPGVRPRSSAGPRARGRRRLADWLTAPAPAGGPTRPRGRRWPPWLLITDTPSSPKTATS